MEESLISNIFPTRLDDVRHEGKCLLYPHIGEIFHLADVKTQKTANVKTKKPKPADVKTPKKPPIDNVMVRTSAFQLAANASDSVTITANPSRIYRMIAYCSLLPQNQNRRTVF